MSEPDVQPDAVPAPASPSRSGRRAEAVSNALRTLVRDLYADLFPAAHVPDELRIGLDLRVSPAEGWALAFDPPLEEQLVAAFEDQEAARASLSAGKVHSYRDDSLVAPPGVRHVFRGYDNFGSPEWCEFAQLLIDSRHPGVDQLYRDRHPRLLCQLTPGRELKSRQLTSFGKSSKTYSLLGQVAVGYLAVPPEVRWPHPERDRIALTFQVVETRTARGAVQVRLNTLCGPADPADVEDLLASPRHAAIRRARDIAVTRLEEITREAMIARARRDGGGLLAAMQRTGRVLRDMARHLERGDRQSQGRTLHAEERRQTGRRPVQKAREDAETAQPESTFRDENRGTFVVWGRHQRAHVFNPEGRHVTSFRLEPAEIEARLRTRKWRPATPEEFRTLTRAIVAARAS